MTIGEKLGILGFTISLSNVGWNIYVHFYKVDRDSQADESARQKTKAEALLRAEEEAYKEFAAHKVSPDSRKAASRALEAGMHPDKIRTILVRALKDSGVRQDRIDSFSMETWAALVDDHKKRTP